MQLILENKAVGRTLHMEVSEAFMQNVDDVRLICGTECYKLVSTKSDTDRKRETLGIEFANEFFPEIQKVNPKDDVELEKLINEKLQTEKYKELASISDSKMLMSTMITSYRRYEAISKKLFDLEKEIESTIMEKNTFYDYILRLHKLIDEATCLKDFHEGIFKLKEMSQCDERIAVGINTIFECATPLLNEEQNLIHEVQESCKGRELSSLPIFTDEAFWTERFTPKAEESIKNLNNLLDYWKGFEFGLSHDNKQELIPKDQIVPKFDYMLNGIMDILRPLIDVAMKFRSLVKDDNDASAIEKARDEMKEKLTFYHTNMRRMEIIESLYPIDYRNAEEACFIDTRFAEYRQVEQAASECAYTGEKYSWQDYLMKLTLNYQMDVAIKMGRVDLKKLLEGTYTEEEIRDLLTPPSQSNPEVK